MNNDGNITCGAGIAFQSIFDLMYQATSPCDPQWCDLLDVVLRRVCAEFALFALFRLEAAADVLCEVMLGNITYPQVSERIEALNVESEHAETAVDVTSKAVPIPVGFSFDAVSGHYCDAFWYTCNTTVSSPSCQKLFQSAANTAYMCSTDPQYLTVSSSAAGLNFAYQVCCSDDASLLAVVVEGVGVFAFSDKLQPSQQRPQHHMSRWNRVPVDV